MDKRPIGYQPGKPSVLDVKVHKTEKYKHVESKLAGKTGTSVKDVEFISREYIIQATRKPRKRRESCLDASNRRLFGSCSTRKRKENQSTTGTSLRTMLAVRCPISHRSPSVPNSYQWGLRLILF